MRTSGASKTKLFVVGLMAMDGGGGGGGEAVEGYSASAHRVMMVMVEGRCGMDVGKKNTRGCATERDG